MSHRERSSKPRALTPSAAERLGTIVEAAERAAESVIDDAETQARRHIAEAEAEAERIAAERQAGQSELIDALLAEAEELRGQAERMIASLERARAEIGTEEGEAPPPPAPRRSHLSAVAEQAMDGHGSLAGARLLATQMAVSGSSREEIELRLRNGFEIDDPAPILEAILGPEDQEPT
jgi:cell division septum initiation protein DivIVA